LKKLCRYHIIKANIPPGVVKLTNNDFLLSNVTNATIICKEQNITHPIRSTAIQWVQNVHCGCVLKADEYVVTATSLHCPLDDNITLSFNPRYLSNLPYLTEFFKDDTLELLQEQDYLSKTLPALLPQLAVASKEYEGRVAIEDDTVFVDLQQVLNRTKNDQLTFDYLSHYLFNVVMRNHQHSKSFDWRNFYDWLVLLATVSGIMALILVLIVQYKVRTLFVLLAATKGAQGLDSEDYDHVYYKTSTITLTATVDYLYLSDLVRKVFSVEIILLLSFLVSVLVFFGYLIYRYRKSIRARTTLLLEL